MTARKFLGYVLVFAVLAVFIGVGLWLVTGFFDQLPAEVAPTALIGLALILASLGVVAQVIVGQTLLQEPSGPKYDPMLVAQEFTKRAAGSPDETKIAQVTGELLEELLTVRRSGWLLFTPQEANVTVQPVPGRGNLPVTPAVIPRNNLLLRQLDVTRQPVLMADLERDPHFAKMPAADRAWLKQLGVAACVPVFDTGLLAAALAIGPKDDRAPFLPGETEIITILAAHATSALKTARVISDLRRANTTMAELNETLRRSNESLAKIDASRSDFLAIASHELRTPITQMLGFADLLGSMAAENALEPNSVSDITNNIVRACGRLGEVIGQILDMAQLDVNALELKFGPTTVENVLRQALEPYAPTMRERRLALKVAGLKSLPPLQADEARLVQAFNQLVSNAIKYTPDGGQVEVSARYLAPAADQPAQVEVCFSDSGIGIDPQYHHLIFEKFYRIGSASQHSTSTTKFMGAGPGLGLPIAKGVIERHGGQLWVESTGHDPSKLPGSRFFVTLPVKPPAFDPRALGDTTPTGTGRRERAALPKTGPFKHS